MMRRLRLHLPFHIGLFILLLLSQNLLLWHTYDDHLYTHKHHSECELCLHAEFSNAAGLHTDFVISFVYRQIGKVAQHYQVLRLQAYSFFYHSRAPPPVNFS